MGRATKVKGQLEKVMDISIHALRGEGDDIDNKEQPEILIFQSTPSVGRATLDWNELCKVYDISIHALRGEGDTKDNLLLQGVMDFNPRPPWGGRLHRCSCMVHESYFNPRPPWGGRLGGFQMVFP